MKGSDTMRAFYTHRTGFTADLCLMLNRCETRLTVRDAAGDLVLRQYYPSWDAAIDALRAVGTGWINDITHETL
jgi:hypothetical protein